MDLSFIFRQLQMLSTNNIFSLVAIAIVILNLLIFLLSRTFRKTGLFVLVLAFGIDYTIKSLPINLYNSISWLYNAVTGLYILGFVIFFTKVLKMSIRINTFRRNKSGGVDSKFKEFLRFTGIAPFIIMIILNLVNFNDFIPDDILKMLTSLSFLYMLIKTVISTSKYLNSKDSFLLKEKMDFKEIKEFLYEEEKTKNPENSKNYGRRVKKSFDKSKNEETIRIYNKPNRTESTSSTYDFKKNSPIRVPKSDENKNESLNNSSKLSNTELINLLSGDFDSEKNTTSMSITNLLDGTKTSYESIRPIFKIHENNEYKIDLEFERVNEYDYGRFIDILLAYSKDKDKYKFELEVSPHSSPNSKIIFFDPSNIYDIDDKDYANVGGKLISMNFPKYKINFITGN